MVTSAANPVVKRMRMLASRKFRQREGISLAEGIQPVWQAVEAGAPVEALIFAPDLLRYQPAVEMVLEQERRGVRVVRLSGELFQRLRNPNALLGKCGRCRFRAICGGSRARAFAATGAVMASDPLCVYEPGPAVEPPVAAIFENKG